MIQFFNTFIAIKNYTKCVQLENALTVKDKLTFKPLWFAFDYQPKKNILIIPKGYSTSYLQKLFPEKQVVYVERDNDTRSVNINADKYQPKNDTQARILEWLFENQRFNKKLVDATMDSGKTYIALKYICECKKIGLIMVHNDGVLNQWIKEITKFTDIEPDEIGIIKGSKSIDECESNLNYKIFIASERTLANILENNKLRLMQFCRNVGVGIKIIDEAHLFLKTICNIDLHTNVNDNIYLTGTAKRADWKENKVLSRILPINYSFTNMNQEFSQVERRITAMFVEYGSHTSTSESAEMYNRYGFQHTLWAKKTIDFIDLLVEIFFNHYKCVEVLMNPKKARLQHAVFLKTLDQCKEFYKILRLKLPRTVSIGMFNSLNEKDKKSALEADIIITTEKSFGVAIDSKINVIHNFIPISSEAPIMQMVGRLRNIEGNETSIFFDYADTSIEGCMKSKAIKKGILKKIALKLYERVYNKERLEMQWKKQID